VLEGEDDQGKLRKGNNRDGKDLERGEDIGKPEEKMEKLHRSPMFHSGLQELSQVKSSQVKSSQVKSSQVKSSPYTVVQNTAVMIVSYIRKSHTPHMQKVIAKLSLWLIKCWATKAYRGVEVHIIDLGAPSRLDYCIHRQGLLPPGLQEATS
jgi:hypothetical protein